jgi:hypothetical protein
MPCSKSTVSAPFSKIFKLWRMLIQMKDEGYCSVLSLNGRLHYRAKSMLDEFARRVFAKFASSKEAISAFLLDEFA